MTGIKKNANVRAKARSAACKCSKLSSEKTISIKSKPRKEVFTGSSKAVIAEDLIPTFGCCYESLTAQYCKNRGVDAETEQKMLKADCEVFAELHDLQLHEIMVNNVEECLDMYASRWNPQGFAIESFNAVINTALRNGIVKKTQNISFYEFSLVIVDFYKGSIGENLECSRFKKLSASYQHLMNLEARQSVERIFSGLRSLITELRYVVFKSMVANIAYDLVTFMYECGLYKPPYSHNERKALVGALVTDTLMVARPKLDVLFIGDVIAGSNLLAERRYGCEVIDG